MRRWTVFYLHTNGELRQLGIFWGTRRGVLADIRRDFTGLPHDVPLTFVES